MVAREDRSLRAHLGRGWAFPVRPVDGGLKYVEHEEDIAQAIEIILATARKERVMRAAFGAGLRTYVFSNNTPSTHRTLENEVRRALLEFEPRISVERVEASADPRDANVASIQIDYVVRRTNAFYNKVFPFYLSEGA